MHVFYEAIGHIIHVKEDRKAQDALIETLMSLPNSIWTDTIEEASKVFLNILTYKKINIIF